MLILEDKTRRQIEALMENGISLEGFENFLDNMINDETSNKFDETIEAIEKDEFDFSLYHTFAIHGSITKNNYKLDDKIRNICLQKNINLVYFSGGDDEINSENVIMLKDETFYGKNLIFFLEKYINGASDLSMLMYGKRWDLNRFYDLIKKIKQIIDDEKNYDKYDDESYLTFGPDLNKAIINFDSNMKGKIKNEWMKVSNAKEILEKIEDYIEEVEDEQ